MNKNEMHSRRYKYARARRKREAEDDIYSSVESIANSWEDGYRAALKDVRSRYQASIKMSSGGKSLGHLRRCNELLHDITRPIR